MDQDSAAPTNKVMAAAAGGALTTVVVWIVSLVSEVEVPAEVAAALTTLIGFVAAYFTREKPASTV